MKKIWWEARKTIDPVELLALPASKPAVLCWGKAAFRTWEVLSDSLKSPYAAPALVVGPAGSGPDTLSFRGARLVYGEHPLPGPGSFSAAAAVLDFFDAVRRNGSREILVQLSGGASSLAWLPPAALGEAELMHSLDRLYRAPLTIQELNRRRARLCLLKGGGAARWARLIAPKARVRVEVISDVEPYGADVVGSGPFWDERTPHRILASNDTLVRSAVRVARASGLPILHEESGRLGDWREWVRLLTRHSWEALRSGKTGLIAVGGEPHVSLPASGRAGRGGRQSQIAAALALELAKPLAQGKVEVLCVCSDGVDGRSGGAGVLLERSAGRALESTAARMRWRNALSRFDSATPLRACGALLPARHSGTNVQDLVLIRISGD